MHRYEDLITIFHNCFFYEYNTILVKGDNEPLYLPANKKRPHHSIFFAHGFFSSALHECSHWLIAGEERRKLEDFGYWYIPDGRSRDEQALFEIAETKPQAIEWILSKAANYPFYLSVDNLNGFEVDTSKFKVAIFEQIKKYCEKGLPKRAEALREALCLFYNTKNRLSVEDFDLNDI